MAALSPKTRDQDFRLHDLCDVCPGPLCTEEHPFPDLRFPMSAPDSSNHNMSWLHEGVSRQRKGFGVEFGILATGAP